MDESIVPVRNELAYYGNLTLKVVNQVRRNFHTFKNAEDLKEYLENIKSRSEVQKVIGYEFSEAHSGIIYLYEFGEKIPGAIQYAFWWYSGFLDDILNEKRMQEFLDGDKSKELTESLKYVAQLVQSLRIWLEKKTIETRVIITGKEIWKSQGFSKFCSK